MAVAAVVAVIATVSFVISGKKLNAKFDEEYGKKE